MNMKYIIYYLFMNLLEISSYVGIVLDYMTFYLIRRTGNLNINDT